MSTIGTKIDRTIANAEQKLAAWGTEIDALTLKNESAGTGKPAENHYVAEVNAKLAIARAKLATAKAAGASKWHEVEKDLERSWKDVEEAFQKVVH